MKVKVLSLFTIICIMLGMMPTAVVSADEPPPPIPNRFYGTASITNSDASVSIAVKDGIVVSARIGGLEKAHVTTLNGKYGYTESGQWLDVPGQSGDVVQFYISNVYASQHNWNSGYFTLWNLAVQDTTVPSTPANVIRTTPVTDNTPTFTWTASNDGISEVAAGVASYEVRIDSGSWVNVGNVTSYTVAALSDGTHTFDVRAIDAVGNTGTAGSVVFTIDTIGPSTPGNVTRTTPVTDNTPTFTWTASTDVTSGVASYEIRIDGGSWANVGNNLTYTVATALLDGSHTFDVRAIDTVSNTGTAGSVVFTIDTTGPTQPGNVTRTTPVTDNTPTFAWTASTDVTSGVVSYEIRIDGGSWANVGNNLTYTVATALLDGSHTFDVRAIDAAGNTGTAGSVVFTIDTTGPTQPGNVTRTTPVTDNTPTFTWTASTDVTSGVVSYEIRIDGGSWANVGNNLTYTVATALLDGSHTFDVRAIDAAGNTGTAGSVVFTIDTTAPSTPTNVVRTTPASDNTPTFTWAASTDVTSGVASYEIRIDSGSWANVGNVTSYTVATALLDGSHTFDVRAIDVAGNTGTAGSVVFTIDTTGPTQPGNVTRTTPVTDNTPTFMWTASTDVTSGVASYEVRMDSGSWTNVGNVTSYTVATALLDGTHTFDVRAIDTVGNTGTAGSAGFTIDATGPTPPGNVTRTTPVTDNTPTFTWAASTDATSGVASYEVRMDSGSWVNVGNVTSYTVATALLDGTHTFDVRAIDTAGNTGTAGGAGFTIDTTGPNAPANITRSTPASDNTPTFTWSAATDALSGIASYEVRIDGGSWVNVGNVTSYTVATALLDGTHTFDVRAIDTAGNTGTAGGAGFTIDTTGPTQPGNVTRTTPVTDNTPTVTWTASTDVTSGVASYEVRMDSGSWANVGNVTSYTVAISLSDGSHTFDVRAIDTAGNTGTSGSAGFTIDATGPTQPGSVTRTTPVTDNTPTFTWTTSTDVLSGLASYEIRLDSGSWVNAGNIISYTVGTVLLDGTHTFDVRAIDTVGNTGTAGSVGFTIDTNGPNAPTSISRSTPASDNTPTFTWAASIDALSGVASYEVRIDSGSWANIGNNLTYTVATALLDGTHTFDVRAIDTVGNTGTAGSAGFTIDTTTPAQPANVVRTTPVSDNTPTFTWTASTDALSGVASYEVRMDSGSWANVGNVTSYTVATALSDGTHTFDVRAIDAAGNTGTAGSAGFTTDATGPTQPANVVRTTPNNDNTPTFTWSASTDATSGVASYEIRIDGGSWTNVGNVTTYTVATALQDGTHTFDVRAIDTAGNTGTAGSAGFTIDATGPNAPTSIIRSTPASDNTPTFTWSASIDALSGIASYEIGIDSGSWVNVGNILTYTVTGELVDGTHIFDVRAIDTVGNTGTTGRITFVIATLDITPPVVTNINTSGITQNIVIISWNTNEPATSQVVYGTNAGYGNETILDTVLVLNHSVTLGGLNTGTTYHYAVKSKDASGSETVSGDNTFSTLSDITAPVISGMNAINVTQSTAQINWLTNELATSQVEWGTTTAYGSITTVDSALVFSHEVSLSGLTANTTYHYRVISKDAVNNNGVSADGTFTTVADITAPLISGVTGTGNTQSTAIISWLTNEPATSQVEWGITTTYGSITAVNPAFVLSHEVSLSGLTAGTTYHYRVKSKDAVNNEAVSADGTLTTAADITAPVISGVSSSGIQDTSASISWTTGEAATSQVEYGTTTAYAQTTTLNPALIFTHSIALTGLTPNTFYHYRVRSKDAANNEAISIDNTFTTLTDLTDPAISGVSVVNLNDTGATIYWNTNEEATTQLEYGTTTAYGTITAINSYPVYIHGVVINGLTPGTLYHYRVKSKDINNNEGVSDDYTFTTLADTTAPTIYGITTSNISDTSVTIYWNTNEAATTQLEYGTTTSYGTTTTLNSSLAYIHGVVINGLTPGTLYHFRVKSQDGATVPNLAVSGDNTVTTLADITAPVINILSKSTTETSVNIVWTTNEPATTQVEYGLSSSYGSSTVLDAVLVRIHSVVISGLTANTDYYFRVRSSDTWDNAASSGNTFKTQPDTTPPVLSNVQTLHITTSSAVISWLTNEPATTTVEWGITTSYGSGPLTNGNMVYSHSMLIVGLSNSTTYNFRITSRDAANNPASTTGSFITTSDNTPPVVTGVNSTNVTGSSAIIQWLTDEPASSQAVYSTTTHPGSYVTDSAAIAAYGSFTAEDTTPVNNHGVVLGSLTSGVTYYYRVISRDGSGNLTVSGETMFSTVDATPPTIQDVVSMPAGNNAFIIWVTDEISTSQVVYSTTSHAGTYTNAAAAMSAYGSSTAEDPAYTESHGQGISSLTATTTYYYRVISRDAAGTYTVSGEYTFTTS